jgi:hypothetical protein
MTYLDDSEREMAKWAHDRQLKDQQGAEDEQRHAMADLTDDPPAAPMHVPT